MHHRPQSTYDHPQELGTSVYDSPVDQHNVGGRPPYPPTGQAPPIAHQQFQQQQQQDYSQSAYPADDSAQLPSAPGMAPVQQPSNHFPPQPQSHAPYPDSPSVQQQAPSHQAPPVPGAGPPPSQYTAFNPAPSAPAGGAEYQAYQPAPAGAPASNPASFYR
jgi:signal transducing adaptor molecule